MQWHGKLIHYFNLHKSGRMVEMLHKWKSFVWVCKLLRGELGDDFKTASCQREFTTPVRKHHCCSFGCTYLLDGGWIQTKVHQKPIQLAIKKRNIHFLWCMHHHLLLENRSSGAPAMSDYPLLAHLHSAKTLIVAIKLKHALKSAEKRWIYIETETNSML